MLSLILRTDKFFMGQDCWITASFPAKRLLIRSHQIRGSVLGGRGEPSPMSHWKWEGWTLCLPADSSTGRDLGSVVELGWRVLCRSSSVLLILTVLQGSFVNNISWCNSFGLTCLFRFIYEPSGFHWSIPFHCGRCAFFEKMKANVKLLIIAKCFSLQKKLWHRTY